MQASPPFYNRKVELMALKRADQRHGRGGQLLLLYGRRRLGKTYLLQHYAMCTAEEHPHCYYLAEQTMGATQRMRLAEHLLQAFPEDGLSSTEIATSWNTLLRYLSEQVRKNPLETGRFLFILDEFQYLVEQAPELPSILQGWWDREGLHLPIFVILCGSQLSLMASLGHENAPLFGRFNAGIFQLAPLSYKDVALFYQNSQYSLADILLMYGILGGTPRYHALVDPHRSVMAELLTLFFEPHAILENEVRFLLGSEQIREPAPYQAILSAIASGATQFSRIQDQTTIARGTLSFHLKVLQELGWIRREFPFGETSERRALYRIADPFLSFWYRFVSPLNSALAFSHPQTLFEKYVQPHLAEYMGRFVFEEICIQWLGHFAQERLGLHIQKLARYWSRDGKIEIDIMGALDTGEFLFSECKWRSNRPFTLNEYTELKAKVFGLAEAQWRQRPVFVLFSLGPFSSTLQDLASDPSERLFLVSGEDFI